MSGKLKHVLNFVLSKDMITITFIFISEVGEL